MVRWKPWGAQDGSEKHERSAASSGIDLEKDQTVQKRWGLGILQDKETDEVPGKYSPRKGVFQKPLGAFRKIPILPESRGNQ